MQFLVPMLMCAAFIFVWIALTKWILALDRRLTKKSLWSSKRLDMKSTAALLQLYFGGKIFLYGRWFPKRTQKGTLYEEIPCILIFGKRIFVLEICSLPGVIRNTSEELWTVTPPAEYTEKKEIRIKNPVLLASRRAELLKELLYAVGYADGVVVESVAIFTNKDHRCANESMQGLYTVKDALGYLSRFVPKNKRDRRRMKRTNGIFFEIFNRYSLSRKSAAAKNNKNLPKKK